MATTKTLNNLVTLNSIVDNEFILVAPNPNTLQTEVLSEIYIHCDTSSQPITIFLPSISTLGYYNAKIYIVDILGAAVTNNITVLSEMGDTINSATSIILNASLESVALSIVSNNQWLAVQSTGSSALPYKVYTALLTQSGGDNQRDITSGTLTIGVTYYITDRGTVNWDFTNVGALSNNVETYFVATGTTPNSWGDANLQYNTGAPVTTVLENTIGNIWFAYNGTGYYHITKDSNFEQTKTFVILTNNLSGNVGIISQNMALGFECYGDEIIQLSTAVDNAYENGVLYNTPIEIRVYN